MRDSPDVDPATAFAAVPAEACTVAVDACAVAVEACAAAVAPDVVPGLRVAPAPPAPPEGGASDGEMPIIANAEGRPLEV